MLPRSKRTTTALFKDIFVTGKVFHSPSFVIRARKNGVDVNRFGISVTKKIAKTAVERNKIKRRIYTALRSIDMLFPVHAVFVVNKSALAMTPKEFAVEIQTVFEKIGLLK